MTNKHDFIEIPHFHNLHGNVQLPGSKSIANRVLLCSALSQAKTQIQNLPNADDIDVLIKNLPLLGVKVECQQSQSTNSFDCSIDGTEGIFHNKNIHPKPIELYLENAGTAFRPLCAILSASYGNFKLIGNEQMNQRPISDLVKALKSLEIEISCSENGCPPVEIKGRGFKGGTVHLNAGLSSQFVSALLMASPLSKNDTSLFLNDKPVSLPYIDLTIDTLSQFSIDIKKINDQEYFIKSKQNYQSPKSFHVEGDATAATYFLAIGSLPGCGPIEIFGLGKNSSQGDLNFVNLLEKMGAKITRKENSIKVSGPTKNTQLSSLGKINMNSMPDAAMTMAVLALFADGETHITDIENLRIKESNRIGGLKNELGKLGATVIEGKSDLKIIPPKQLTTASIETYQDHRMAMAFSIAGYGTNLKILNPNCVSKTYKNYFKDFFNLY